MRDQASEARMVIMASVALVVGALLLASSAFGQDNRGSSDLGLCHPKYDYAKFISKFQGATAIRTRWLDNTFNPNGCPNAVKLLTSPKPLELSVHIINGPGLRNGRLEKHEIHYGMNNATFEKAVANKDPKFMAKFDSRLARLKNLLRGRSGPMKLSISPCLECDLTGSSRLKLLLETRKYFPEAELIDNPDTDRCLTGFLCEKHGRLGRGDSVDLDGDDYDGVDAYAYGKRNAGIKQVFAWKACNNGFKRGEAWVHPTKRVNFCGARDSQDIGYWLRPEALDIQSGIPNDKNGCKAFLSPKDGDRKGFTWKLGDGRNYAVALFPPKFKHRFTKVEVRHGGVVDTGHFRAIESEHGTGRLIYDFTKPLALQQDNSVLFADGQCWVLEKPQFRID